MVAFARHFHTIASCLTTQLAAELFLNWYCTKTSNPSTHFLLLLHQQPDLSVPLSFATQAPNSSPNARRSPNTAVPFQEGFNALASYIGEKDCQPCQQVDRRRPHLDSRLPAHRLSIGSCETPVWQINCSWRLQSLVKGDSAMVNKTTKKCAHIPCRCEVTNGNKYCGQGCQDAGSDEVEIACDCSHLACPLTA